MSVAWKVAVLAAVAALSAVCMAGCSCSVNESDVVSAASAGAATVSDLLSTSEFGVAEDGSIHGKLGMFGIEGDAPDENGLSEVRLVNADDGSVYATGTCVIGENNARVTFGVFGATVVLDADRAEDGTWTSRVGLA